MLCSTIALLPALYHDMSKNETLILKWIIYSGCISIAIMSIRSPNNLFTPILRSNYRVIRLISIGLFLCLFILFATVLIISIYKTRGLLVEFGLSSIIFLILLMLSYLTITVPIFGWESVLPKQFYSIYQCIPKLVAYGIRLLFKRNE